MTDRQRALEDLRNRVARDLFSDAVNFEDLTPEQQQQVRESTAFRRGEDDINRRSRHAAQDFRQEYGFYQPGTQFGDEGIRQVLELLQSGEITAEQATPFIGSRRVEAFQEQQASTTAAEAQAAATATAIQTALEPLISQNQTTADTEATTADTMATTADKAATTAQTESETAPIAAATAQTESETAALNASIAEKFDTATNLFSTGSETLHQAATEIAEADIDQIATEIARIPDSMLLLNETIEGLPERLDSVLTISEGRLAGLFSEGSGRLPESFTEANPRVPNLAPVEPRALPDHIETLSVSANTVNVSGNIRGGERVGQRNEPPIVIEDRTTTVVEVDKRELGRVVGEGEVKAELRGDRI